MYINAIKFIHFYLHTYICMYIIVYIYIYIYCTQDLILQYFEAVSSFQPRSFPNKTQLVGLSLPGVTLHVPPSWWWFLRQFLLDPWTDLNMQGVSGPDKRHVEVPSGHVYFNLHHWTSLWETSNAYMEFLCQTCQLLRSKARQNAFTCKLLLCMLCMPASGSTCQQK